MTKQQQVIARLRQQSILILGAGLSGLSCLKFLHAHQVPCAVNDSRKNAVNTSEFAQDFPEVTLVQGVWDQTLIQSADLIIISPGIDPSTHEIAVSIASHAEVIGDVELFCRLVDAPIAAITGSNGKSTVVSALAHVGRALGKNIVLGGNVGLPILAQIDEETDCYVLELSSFQLETIQSLKAKVATVLNVSDDHLDRHHTIHKYSEVKRRIYRQCELAIVNADDSLTFIDDVPRKMTFGGIGSGADFAIESINEAYYLSFQGKKLAPLASLPLAGIHNGLNYLAVLALGRGLGWKITDILTHLGTFKGLPHRCQVITSNDNITWINDSKATNVGATVAAIEGIGPTISESNQLIVIAGGEGKGAEFSPLAKLFKQYVSHVILLGKDAQKIAKHVATAHFVGSMEEAVKTARKCARAGDTVLLSPACASIDMFTNFAQRGQAFADAVHHFGGSVS